MPVIAEDERIAELTRLAVSDTLVRLSCGHCLHEIFRDTCVGPPFYVYHGARIPDGPPLVPLWDCCDSVVGVWERPDGLEFIEFSIEAPAEYTTLAHTEQGLWATQFDFFYECDTSVEQLREAAAKVGFRFLDRLLAARAVADRLDTFGAHDIWLKDLVAGIDRESGIRH